VSRPSGASRAAAWALGAAIAALSGCGGDGAPAAPPTPQVPAPVGPDPDTLVTLAERALAEGDRPAAEVLAAHALSRRPDDPRARRVALTGEWLGARPRRESLPLPPGLIEPSLSDDGTAITATRDGALVAFRVGSDEVSWATPMQVERSFASTGAGVVLAWHGDGGLGVARVMALDDGRELLKGPSIGEIVAFRGAPSHRAVVAFTRSAAASGPDAALILHDAWSPCDGPIADVAVSPDGAAAVAACADGALVRWEIGSLRGRPLATPLSGPVQRLLWGGDALFAADDAQIQRLDARTGRVTGTFVHRPPLVDVAVSADGRWLATLAGGRVAVRGPEHPEDGGVTLALPGVGRDLGFTADGALLVLGDGLTRWSQWPPPDAHRRADARAEPLLDPAQAEAAWGLRLDELLAR
jgi:hypothetical protein